ncbi:restriction endonuclease subunit S [Candidatus Micrarchaeota archaeon]|nr:restriction endonuclease subunit S [Candidatus Micrarchaeota archaeon]
MKNTHLKETEIGEIPEEWQLKRVDEIAVINEAAVGKKYQCEEIEYIDIDSVEEGQIKTVKKMKLAEAPSRAKRIVKKNDILISTVRPNLKHYAFISAAKPNTVASTGFAVISAKGIDPRFLYYCLTTQKYTNYLSAIADAHTSTYPSFNPDIIENSNIPYPPIPEQHIIAKILSDLDAKIELNRQMNQTLEQIGEALFKRWFVDFEFPNEEGKPYKSSGGEMVDSELGEIPKGWNASKLGEHVSMVRGCSYSSAGLKDSENALVTLKSIERGGGFKTEGFKPYIGEFKDKHIVKNGEIIVAHTDLTQNAEVLGKPAIVREVPYFNKLIASMDLGIIRPTDDRASNPFLYYLLKSDQFQNHAYGYASGTTVLHLSSKAIPDFQFILARKEVITRFTQIVEKLTMKIQYNFSEAENLEKIRDTLLPKLMSGQIRVKIPKESAN